MDDARASLAPCARLCVAVDQQKRVRDVGVQTVLTNRVLEHAYGVGIREARGRRKSKDLAVGLVEKSADLVVELRPRVR